MGKKALFGKLNGGYLSTDVVPFGNLARKKCQESSAAKAHESNTSHIRLDCRVVTACAIDVVSDARGHDDVQRGGMLPAHGAGLR